MRRRSQALLYRRSASLLFSRQPSFFLVLEPVGNSGRGRELLERLLWFVPLAPTDFIHIGCIRPAAVFDFLAHGRVGQPAIPCLWFYPGAKGVYSGLCGVLRGRVNRVG